MNLELRAVSKEVGPEVHLHPMTLALAPGRINVLLGATRAGKTSLMRLMAGLDRPSGGSVHADGVDVTALPARGRNLAMVFQQFINYPAMTVFENIASPLRLQRRPAQEIKGRVEAIAARLHIDHLLGRLPQELSGGQQQRTALARALAKGASLLLLDEPLVNLDYKLREELRTELVALFTAGETTVVYATTEPQEALLLGGHTAVLHQGRLLQHGPTLGVYARPATVEVSAAFSDPPMNLVDAVAAPGGVQLAEGVLVPVPRLPDGLAPGQACRAGIRPNHLRLEPPPGGGVALGGTVDLAELSGSETLLHLRLGASRLVAQLPGIRTMALGSRVAVHLDPRHLFLFDAAGRLLLAPAEARHGQD